MSIFPFRRSEDESPVTRLAELERAHKQLARELEAARAQFADEIELLWTIASPPWLRDGIQRARESGWMVVRSRDRIEFQRPEAEHHTYGIDMPLPDSDEEVDRIRQELNMRLLAIGQQAA